MTWLHPPTHVLRTRSLPPTENGDSFKLPSPDSAHVEIIRVGTFNEEWGGVSRERIREAMAKILVPHVEVTPSFVLRNGDKPPGE